MRQNPFFQNKINKFQTYVSHTKYYRFDYPSDFTYIKEQKSMYLMYEIRYQLPNALPAQDYKEFIIKKNDLFMCQKNQNV